jgi:type VI secretion system protein ImpE
MEIRVLLQEGRVGEALSALKGAVGANPRDESARMLLFQAFCLVGDWERALNQLRLGAGVSSEMASAEQVLAGVIQAETQREKVFAGTARPTILGRPEPWIASLVQACELFGKGETTAALRAREHAVAGAPAVMGTANSHPFKGFEDSDMRLGPVLEVCLPTGYYWVPVCRMATVTTVAPSTVLDAVWTAARLTWADGGTSVGYIPTRYPGTDRSDDPELLCGRKTVWKEIAEGVYCGAGQRLFFASSPEAEYPLLELRELVVEHEQPEAASKRDA